MSVILKASLSAILLATTFIPVNGQAASTTSPANPIKTIPAPNGATGWCYYCSDTNAPPLCNSQCSTAINRLCGETLTEALTSTEQDCEIQFLPPTWEFRRNGARPPTISESQCIDSFNGILSNCGKDAGSPVSGVNQSYCTTSGGGGTFGWNDDGTPIAGSARFIVKTTGTDQCGQWQAPWQQAPFVIEFDPSKSLSPCSICIILSSDVVLGWIKDTDQVVLVTDPPSASASAALASMSAMPTLNPVCDTEPCNIFGDPYYASSPQNPWQDGTSHMLRHRVLFEGWDPEAGALTFFNALHDRCQQWPYNWQVYKNGSQSVADFGLPSWQKAPPKPAIFDTGDVTDYCWCISYALFDASVGISLPVNAFCLASTQFPSTNEFAPARKRGLEIDAPSLFKSVDKVIAKRSLEAAKAKRDLIQDISGVERD